MNPLTYSHTRDCNQRTSVTVLLVSWIYMYPQWVKCVSVWGQTTVEPLFAMVEGQWMQTPPHFPIVLLPDTCCEARSTTTLQRCLLCTHMSTHIYTHCGAHGLQSQVKRLSAGCGCRGRHNRERKTVWVREKRESVRADKICMALL